MTTKQSVEPVVPLTAEQVWQQLRTVVDPETSLNIVAMGLVYDVLLTKTTTGRDQVVITHTLTTPGCPLAGTLTMMIQQSLDGLRSATFDPERDVQLNLTFDPPWTIDLMSDEAKAELGW